MSKNMVIGFDVDSIANADLVNFVKTFNEDNYYNDLLDYIQSEDFEGYENLDINNADEVDKAVEEIIPDWMGYNDGLTPTNKSEYISNTINYNEYEKYGVDDVVDFCDSYVIPADLTEDEMRDAHIQCEEDFVNLIKKYFPNTDSLKFERFPID